MKANNSPKKKSALQKVLLFVGVMLLCTLAGGVVGYCFSAFELDRVDAAALRLILAPFAANVMPFLVIAMWIAAILFCLVRYRRAKGDFSRWDGEDEAIIERTEHRLSHCAIISNAAFILNLFLFSVWCSLTLQMEDLGWRLFLMLAAFFLGLIAGIVIQRAVVELEKKINPEKRGDILDFNFQKQWYQSFDEAERVIAGQAAFKAFQAVNTACIALWLICMLGDMILHTGPGAVTVITVIWLLSTLVFQIEASRLERGR